MGSRLVLAVDNSVDFLNVAISLEDKLVEERHFKSSRPPSEVLPLAVSHMLETHGFTPDDVQVIVASLGPGSFTGIRVALAFCKGMSAAKGIPLIGVPTLDVLAAPLTFVEGYHLLPIIDAKKGELFCALYKIEKGKREQLTPHRALKPKAVRELVRTPCACFGTGVAIWEDMFPAEKGITIIRDGFSRLSGEWLIREGLRRSDVIGPQDLKPIYGRKSEAEIKFNVEIP